MLDIKCFVRVTVTTHSRAMCLVSSRHICDWWEEHSALCIMTSEYPNILCNVRRAQIFIVDYCYTIIIIVVVINTDFAMDRFSYAAKDKEELQMAIYRFGISFYVNVKFCRFELRILNSEY